MPKPKGASTRPPAEKFVGAAVKAEAEQHPVRVIVVRQQRRGLMRRKQWTWRALGYNNTVLAWAGEGYSNLAECEDIARRLWPGIAVAMPGIGGSMPRGSMRPPSHG